MRLALLVAVLCLAGCRGGPPRPVDIDPADMCARCRMAISQNRYAAELIGRDGNVSKFDDLGCMIHYTRGRQLNPNSQIYFVMDYNAQRWLAARQAFYVRSNAIPAPMSGGLAAFGNRGEADRFAAEVHGAVLGFEELWTSTP